MKELFIKYKEVIRYLIVGVMTTVISLGSYYIFTRTFLDPENALQLQIANVLSWICAVTFSYIASRRYVFESKNPNIVKEVLSFFAARLATLGMDMGIMFIGTTLLHIDDRIVKLFVQFVVIIANYVFSKLLVFKKQDA